MRVLHVLPSIAPSYGGPSTALIGLSNALSARGVYTETVTTDLGMEEGRNLNYGGLSEFRGVKVRFFPRMLPARLPRDFALSPKLGGWLKAHIRDFDIVNIHGLFNYPNSVAASIAYKAGVPYVIRPCGMLDPWCLKQSRFKKVAYLKLFGYRHLRNAAAFSFTTSEEEKLAYKVARQPPGVVIPLGVTTTEDTREQDDLLLPRDKKVILFLSRLDKKKGIDLLISSVARLKDIRNDFLCVVAGGGNAEYEARIKAEVKVKELDDVVWFSGFVEGERKRQLLKAASCFALPSYQENFGLSVAEAMAAGCPVVISDQVNIHKDISESNAGRVVRCDVDELCSALDEVLSDEAMQRTMGLNGQRLVREKYDWDKVGERFITLYKTCIEQHPRRDR
jgi:glycosyltransferase involved in cell wall biosynthesis